MGGKDFSDVTIIELPDILQKKFNSKSSLSDYKNHDISFIIKENNFLKKEVEKLKIKNQNMHNQIQTLKEQIGQKEIKIYKLNKKEKKIKKVYY